MAPARRQRRGVREGGVCPFGESGIVHAHEFHGGGVLLAMRWGLGPSGPERVARLVGARVLRDIDQPRRGVPLPQD
eukprot:4594734-Pyramimonas_sp.AAC.1